MLHFIKKITSIHAIHISNFKKLNYTSGFFFKHLLDFAIKPVIHCNLSKKKKKKNRRKIDFSVSCTFRKLVLSQL